MIYCYDREIEFESGRDDLSDDFRTVSLCRQLIFCGPSYDCLTEIYALR